MQIRLGLLPAVILFSVFSTTDAANFTFSFQSPTQCDNFPISWSGRKSYRTLQGRRKVTRVVMSRGHATLSTCANTRMHVRCLGYSYSLMIARRFLGHLGHYPYQLQVIATVKVHFRHRCRLLKGRNMLCPCRMQVDLEQGELQMF